MKKKSIQIAFLVISYFIFFAHIGWSQQNNSYSIYPYPEKIYLQLDSKVYTNDQIIWFKSIVTDASNHIPTKLSRVLYVELINPTEEIIEKKLIKIENGIGEGYFELNEKYMEGSYLIRAYTNWNKNFDPAFFFKTYIHVFSTSKEEKANPISNITLVEKENNKRTLEASFNPLIIDKLHTKELKLIVTLDDKKDTLNIKKGRGDKYKLNYKIPDKCNFVTLQIQTKNLISHSKTIILDESYLDLQFFPESGELVHGLKSKVGFKALGSNGKGKFIDGVIVNQQGEVVTKFESNKLGIGYFTLPKADSTISYSAMLNSQSEESLPLIYPLPPVVKMGNVLSVAWQGDKIRIVAASNYLKNDSIYFRASCRGIEYFDIKGRLKKGQLMFTLPSNSLPEGIIAFTMMDKLNQSIAERLFFNKRPESRINIGISTDKESYVQRELTTLNIEITNHKNEAISANLSVLVFNNEQMGQMESTRQQILSYFLLSSDLKGEIEYPGFYFNRDLTRYDDLDALMITQGWRKYNYTKLVDSIFYKSETSLSISGSVGDVFLQNKKKVVNLLLMTLGKSQYFYSQTTDSLGEFNFNIYDEFGKDLKILINSKNQDGENKDYFIELDKTCSPVISFNHIKSGVKVDSTVHALVLNNMERKIVGDSFRMSEGTTLLDEIVITGYNMTPQRRLVMEKYGKPRVVISGKTLQEKEEEWSFGLYSVLMFHYSDKVRIVQRGNHMFARVIGAPSFDPGDGVTLIVIDGIPVKEFDYPLIAYIPPSEVKSFEIIQSASQFLQLYLEADPGTPVLEAPTIGSVIAIYTRTGKGLHNIQKPVGLLHATVPVFSEPHEFYAPKHANLSDNDWAKPDLRALVHWEPKIVIDSSGKGTTSFYNADNLGEMKIILEAISKNGEIGYQELIFNVENNNN